jgi:hypothetical protein
MAVASIEGLMSEAGANRGDVLLVAGGSAPKPDSGDACFSDWLNWAAGSGRVAAAAVTKRPGRMELRPTRTRAMTLSQ